jgi:hypothetical protein
LLTLLGALLLLLLSGQFADGFLRESEKSCCGCSDRRDCLKLDCAN